jgi:hypothetical protein
VAFYGSGFSQTAALDVEAPARLKPDPQKTEARCNGGLYVRG